MTNTTEHEGLSLRNVGKTLVEEDASKAACCNP